MRSEDRSRRAKLTEFFGSSALADGPSIDWWQVVASIVSSIASAIQANETKHWQADVSDKLDRIIATQYLILDDLRQLRADIDEMFVTHHLQELMEAIDVSRQMLDIALAGGGSFDKIPPDQKLKIQAIADKTERDSLQLQGVGLGGYHFVAVGFGILSVVYRLLRYNRSSFRKLCDVFSNYFRGAVDPDKNGSFAERLRYANFAIENYAPFLNRFESVAYSPTRVTDQHPYYGSFMSLAGWANGNRIDGYGVQGFDGIVGDLALAPKFVTADPAAVWPPIDPSVVYARQRFTDIVGETNTIASNLRWANHSVQTLTSAVSEIEEVLRQIARARAAYPRF